MKYEECRRDERRGFVLARIQQVRHFQGLSRQTCI